MVMSQKYDLVSRFFVFLLFLGLGFRLQGFGFGVWARCDARSSCLGLGV